MKKTFNHYIDGKRIATYKQPTGRKYRTLKSITQSRRHIQHSARLLAALSK